MLWWTPGEIGTCTTRPVHTTRETTPTSGPSSRRVSCESATGRDRKGIYMSHRGVALAMLIIAGIAASLGCCCPVPGPIMQPPPIVIQEQPLIVQGPDLAAQRAEELKKVIAQNLGPNKEAGTLA